MSGRSGNVKEGALKSVKRRMLESSLAVAEEDADEFGDFLRGVPFRLTAMPRAIVK